MLSPLTAPFLALFLSLGGFNWSFGSQTDTSGTATVEISSDEAVSNVRVLIKGSDGSEVEKTVNLKAGKPTKITWKQKDRQVTYEISIEAGEAYTNGEFEVIKPVAGGSQGAFTLISDREEIVDKQKIRYKTPFTLSSRQIEVFNTEGDRIHEDTIADEVIEAGETFEMSWRTTDEVFMIKVTGSDDTGYSYTDTRVPWAVEIPHTEVNFDSGKHNIKSDEEWKVSEAFAVLVHELDGIDKANKAVNGDIQVQLYIVGYTDTVGNAGDNAKLSNNRAREIAQYFVDKGAWCEIYYAGMGERGLAVETGDSVDEVRNRRALYILGPQKPGAGGHIPGSWTLLASARPRMMQKLPDPPESYLKYKEEQRQKRIAKFGGGGDGDAGGDGDVGSDDGGGSGDGGSGDGGSSGSGDSGGSSGGGSGGDGPPDIEGEPGGTKQGCAVDEPRGGAGALGLLALLGFVGLRRRKGA